jgi:phenylacetate-coenzyme A ligase PaaK-like adenylate-forming protein
MGTDGNIKILSNMQPAIVLGVPSYVYHVIRMAKEKGLKLSSIKKVVLGAGRVDEPLKARMRSELESMGCSNVAIFGTYGFTEARAAWAECPSPAGTSSGYHIYPDKEIFEIIDPDTGEVKGEGEDGELVYTAIDARASAVIRYRTGDFVKGGISYEPCPHCGRTVPRISSDITRISDIKGLDLSKIKGQLVNLNNCTSTLNEFNDIKEWQLEIKKRNNDPHDLDEMIIYVCPQESADKTKLEKDIRNKILLTTEVSPNAIMFVSFDEIVNRLQLETANKEKRILDSRPKG